MPALYAGKRVGKPLMRGHTYNAMFNGKLVWPPRQGHGRLHQDHGRQGKDVAQVSSRQRHPETGSEGATVFEPRNYGPKTLKTGTLQCNIFINTTGEVDKTFTPRLYKID